MKPVALLLPLVLFHFFPAGRTQEPPPHPLQEDRDLHNSTLLPRLQTEAKKRLTELTDQLEKKAWNRAARLLDGLIALPGDLMVRKNSRIVTGLLNHLAHLVNKAPADLEQALHRLTDNSWQALWQPGLIDRDRLTRLVFRYPFHRDGGSALLRLADIHLEAGRPAAALSILLRIDLLPPGARSTALTGAREKRQKAARRILDLTPEAWPVPRGGPGQMPRPQKMKAKFTGTELEWYVAGQKNPRAGHQTTRLPGWPGRGVVKPRGELVLCNGQTCLHDGRCLWRIDPQAWTSCGDRLPLTGFLGLTSPPFSPRTTAKKDLPRCLAADGDRLALIVGPRPEPGTAPGHHGLACLRIRPGDTLPKRLWCQAGALKGKLPPDLNEEDARVLSTGPLAFGAGPVWVDHDLLATIFVPLDKTKVSCFLGRFAGETGELKWVRFLAQGAPEAIDPLFDRLSTMPFPQLVGAPLCLHGNIVFVATDLGTVHAVDTLIGRPLWAYRVARIKPDAEKQKGFIRSSLVVNQGRVLAGLKDSEWIYLFHATTAPGASPLLAPPLPRRNLAQVVGLKGRHALFTAGNEGEFWLERMTIPNGEIYQAPPLQSGEHFLGTPILTGNLVFFCTERYLFRADLLRDLYLGIDAEPGAAGKKFLGSLIPWQGGLISTGPRGFTTWR